TFDVATRTRILTIDKTESIHHGGPPGFGRDGFLYLPLGDGLAAPDGNSQDPSVLPGKVLRLDLSEVPYRVPDDNPFVGVAGTRPEIWALGFRNPWGWAFDPEDPVLWIGDVGGTHEEINRVVAGGNYGWPYREGGACTPRGPCDPSFIDAVYEYPNGGGAA